METLHKKLSSQERQANIDRLIQYLITTKREALDEIKEDFQKPEVQKLFQQMQKKRTNGQATVGI